MMPTDADLIIIGASARAAAFSAVRAGYRPYCADLFADADLQARAACRRLRPDNYPVGFIAAFRTAPRAPWIYTGGLENHPALLRRLAALRPLWGNGAATVRNLRSPWQLAAAFAKHRIAYPALRREPPHRGDWLQKPLRSAGGRGIDFWRGRTAGDVRGYYFQEYIDGSDGSAVFVGCRGAATLLGVTRQLVGKRWLFAKPFAYCGSIGPLTAPGPLRQHLERIGTVLVTEFALRGLFGVDFILRDGVPFPVEVNPRYTASVEVLELGAGIRALSLHAAAFAEVSSPTGPPLPESSARQLIGKAVLFAPRDLSFPHDGPWQEALQPSRSMWEVPTFADVPQPGSHLKAGSPVLSFFCTGDTEDDCLTTLSVRAGEIIRALVTHAAGST